MKSDPITYENMVAALIRALPELKPTYDREIKRWEEEMGPHIMYRYVMFDAMEQQLKFAKHPDEALLRKMFDFLEVLANHPDEDVHTVAHQAVCEKICSDEVVLQKAQKYMGKKAKEFCAMIVGPDKPRHGP